VSAPTVAAVRAISPLDAAIDVDALDLRVVREAAEKCVGNTA
jgi:hypothetical protein